MSQEIMGQLTELTDLVREKAASADVVDKATYATGVAELQAELKSLRDDLAAKSAPRHDAQDVREQAAEAFANFMVKGFDPKNELHRKAAAEANFLTGEAGGFTIPRVVDPEIGELLRQTSPVRSMARVISAPMGYVHLAKNSKPAASKRAEGGAVTDGQVSTYNEITFGSAEFYENAALSIWTLDGDSPIDFAAQAKKDILAGLAELEAQEHLLGTTQNTIKYGPTPTAVLVNSGLLTLGVSANANRFTNDVGKLGGVMSAANKAVTFDDLIKLQASLHSNYSGNAKYLFGSELETQLFTLKDGNGNYVWALNQAIAGGPATIRGKEYAVSDFMPDINTAANGAVTVLYGDFSKYLITEQAGVSWVFDPITDLRRVKYHARMRQGSGLTDFQAMRALTNKAGT
ncbi:phage major capsid protein [Caulobacter sp. FWC2]|uniref:phage major capsid protein n=1 Tax=Caulobacter sp. FWC2 TaxID=69664 RepID=UPI00130427CD|nr:phage major capsid protein [Caulobacter sp. FWC2]